MPRLAREKSSNGIYHIMLRGINRQTIFEDDEDRGKFMELLRYYKTTSGYQLFAYCLMDNHIHLLMKETIESISNTVKRLSSGYITWYNKKYERCGHLFQERFKSEVVDSDQYLITVLRYIHQNPVKAGMVEKIERYKWSSYPEYIGKAVLVDTDFALDILAKDRGGAIDLFQQYTQAQNEDQCLEYKEKINVSDKELLTYMKRLGFGSVSDIQTCTKEVRNDVIRRLKGREGATIRQVSRVTGISKSVIARI